VAAVVSRTWWWSPSWWRSIAAVVAELTTGVPSSPAVAVLVADRGRGDVGRHRAGGRGGRRARHPRAGSTRRPGGGDAVLAELAAELVAAPLDLDALAEPSGRIERSGVQRDAAEPLQVVADPVAIELEAALALRRSGADPKALRRALRRIEELLDE
jgi:hypothetical protein